jgi:hypothetical protein
MLSGAMFLLHLCRSTNKLDVVSISEVSRETTLQYRNH